MKLIADKRGSSVMVLTNPSSLEGVSPGVLVSLNLSARTLVDMMRRHSIIFQNKVYLATYWLDTLAQYVRYSGRMAAYLSSHNSVFF